MRDAGSTLAWSGRRVCPREGGGGADPRAAPSASLSDTLHPLIVQLSHTFPVASPDVKLNPAQFFAAELAHAPITASVIDGESHSMIRRHWRAVLSAVVERSRGASA
jgi:hypothetical protein